MVVGGRRFLGDPTKISAIPPTRQTTLCRKPNRGYEYRISGAIYTHVQRERERVREREGDRERGDLVQFGPPLAAIRV